MTTTLTKCGYYMVGGGQDIWKLMYNCYYGIVI